MRLWSADYFIIDIMNSVRDDYKQYANANNEIIKSKRNVLFGMIKVKTDLSRREGREREIFGEVGSFQRPSHFSRLRFAQSSPRPPGFISRAERIILQLTIVLNTSSVCLFCKF